MAAEARAMLDALMGQDRNASIVPAPKDGNQDWDSLRKKKSCYDNDVCPLYCAWGVDLYELFTNTKSDLGPNPYQVRDDAREEYLSLPEHEKDRLGFERMLHRKLGDLVRSCDRIVSRNKEKLRQEIAQAAKKRGVNASRIDPVTDVSDEMIREAAEIMADLELHEEQVSECLVELTKVDDEWKKLWDELQSLLQTSNNDAVASSIITNTTTTAGNSNNTSASTETDNLLQNGENLLESYVKEETTEQDTQHEHNDSKEDETNFDQITLDKIKTVKSRLYALSSEQQKIIAKIANMTTQTIVPLRDSLLNLTKQLYYVKTDMSEDKTVCEVSGNFMSFRDAEERIAAHYAGKQYVGWKMVRDKFKELEQKAKSWRPSPVGPSSVSNVGRHGGGGGGGGGSNRGGYGPPQPSRGHGYPPPITGQGGRSRQGDRYGYGHPDRNDRSRSRDRGDSQRWERDRGPVPRGGSGGEYSRRND
eukprot:CAMPEP_0176481946 /NCGR_PEP_ID=MMETSP0200_2-20121128/3106_1 /TAXON_ID=947934 /ORGANISM="Chaetoceros sp., Strain GSL56" /LENGTH=475 /DNA_ID=CAMNT_0017878215 /DNA_START=49 /DNA_END=1473 /DNA_ORIENTATION=+